MFFMMSLKTISSYPPTRNYQPSGHRCNTQIVCAVWTNQHIIIQTKSESKITISKLFSCQPERSVVSNKVYILILIFHMKSLRFPTYIKYPNTPTNKQLFKPTLTCRKLQLIVSKLFCFHCLFLESLSIYIYICTISLFNHILIKKTKLASYIANQHGFYRQTCRHRIQQTNFISSSTSWC